MSFAALLAEIDDNRSEDSNLSSALRVYCFKLVEKANRRSGPKMKIWPLVALALLISGAAKLMRAKHSTST